ncbi:hypothetical protein DYP60_01310 [Sphaerochaeta halotolerans]|jgi:hypothetical protein|uniref:Uncharacterized protein n=1 Tax=Sphaerochaeta halotolerans TaxID=2293840 RepID=A0A372MLE8_9SPIR|nr:hypothetical protein DYP60_01310 [Sphaerochaeta halotolerans]
MLSFGFPQGFSECFEGNCSGSGLASPKIPASFSCSKMKGEKDFSVSKSVLTIHSTLDYFSFVYELLDKNDRSENTLSNREKFSWGLPKFVEV